MLTNQFYNSKHISLIEKKINTKTQIYIDPIL